MIRTALWIVGPPAAGKTTLARAFLGDLSKVVLVSSPKWTIAEFGRIVAAGHYTGDTFDGADRIGYSGARAALDYWLRELQPKAEVTIFDGDRFSYAGAVDFVRPWVDEVVVEHVTAPAEVLAARRAERNWSPNPQWLKGRETKAARFARAYPRAT